MARENRLYRQFSTLISRGNTIPIVCQTRNKRFDELLRGGRVFAYVVRPNCRLATMIPQLTERQEIDRLDHKVDEA